MQRGKQDTRESRANTLEANDALEGLHGLQRWRDRVVPAVFWPCRWGVACLGLQQKGKVVRSTCHTAAAAQASYNARGRGVLVVSEKKWGMGCGIELVKAGGWAGGEEEGGVGVFLGGEGMGCRIIVCRRIG